MEEFLNKWQSLIGAFLGALIPIVFSIALLLRQNNKKFLNNLAELDILLAISLTETYAARKELELFIERMDGLLKEIPTSRPAYFIADTNFPTLKLDFGNRFIETRTGSLYLTNKLLSCHIMLKDINNAVADLQYEFRRGLRENHERILSASSMNLTIDSQKSLLSKHAESMKIAVQGILLDTNIPVVTKNLAIAREYLLLYYKAPTIIKLWYENIPKFFGMNSEIDKKLEERVQKSMLKAEERYKEQWAGFSTISPPKNTPLT